MLYFQDSKGNNVAWIGVSADKLSIAEAQSHERFIIRSVHWSDIRKLSFKRHIFTVEPKRLTDAQPKKEKFRFVTANHHR